jgi:hypothetical protein
MGAGSAWGDATYVTAETGMGYDSNISRGEKSANVLEDFSLTAGIRAAHSMRINSRSGVIVSSGLNLTGQDRYDDLSRLKLDVGARYMIQPVPGFTAPWFEAGFNLGRLQYADSDIRDGWQNTLSLSAPKYFTDRIRLTAGVDWIYREADEARVFDYNQRALRLAANYKASGKLMMYGGYSRIHGDQVSTAISYGYANWAGYAKAYARDTALEDNGHPRNAYRIGAVTDTFDIGINYALCPGTAVDINIQRFNADADGGHRYDGYTAMAGLLYRF